MFYVLVIFFKYKLNESELVSTLDYDKLGFMD